MTYIIHGERSLRSGAIVLEDRRVQRSYVRVQVIESSSATTDTREIEINCGHAIGEPYPLNASALLRTITPRQISAHVWEVTLSYATGRAEFIKNPLQRPTVYSWSAYEIAEPFETDLDDVPVLTSAGEMYDPPAMIDTCIMVLSAVQNEPDYDYTKALQYANSVNSDTFLGANPGYVRCRAPLGKEVFEEEYYYWQVSYEFHFSPYKWNKPVKDIGTYYLDGDGKQQHNVRNGVPSTAPILLDGNGGKLDGTTPVYLTFKKYRELPFSGLLYN